MSDSTLPVALITGAAKRIGAAMVRSLHPTHNIVLHFHHSDEAAKKLADELNALRTKSVTLVKGNISERTTISALVDSAQANYARLDVLINNASAFYPTPINEVTDDDWQQLVGSNLKGPTMLIQAARALLAKGNGNIINMLDMHIQRPLPKHTIYCLAKAGLANLTQSLAVELAPQVRVNGIAPGAILWPERGLDEAEQQALLNSIPMQRLGSVDDITQAMLFLLDAPYITGHILTVDGGRNLMNPVSA